jgi:hypothetical protein
MSTQSPGSTSPQSSSNVQGEKILVLDFGSQTAQLIARRVREQNVFCQMVRHDLSADRIREIAPKALILSGGPASVYEKGCKPRARLWAARSSPASRASSGTRPATHTRPIRSSPMCRPTRRSG